MKSSDQISADINSLLLEKHLDFELLNTYKGVPFSCKAVLQQVEAGEVLFKVNPTEAVLLVVGNRTLLLSDGLLEPIEAQVAFMDMSSGHVGLTQFTFAGSKLSNRKELRVEPDERISVYLETKGLLSSGALLDLSMRGMGMRLNREAALSFQQGQEVEVVIHLEGAATRLAGKVLNIISSGDFCRLSLKFVGVAEDKTPIVRYIMRRRHEIHSEIRNKYEQFKS